MQRVTIFGLCLILAANSRADLPDPDEGLALDYAQAYVCAARNPKLVRRFEKGLAFHMCLYANGNEAARANYRTFHARPNKEQLIREYTSAVAALPAEKLQGTCDLMAGLPHDLELCELAEPVRIELEP